MERNDSYLGRREFSKLVPPLIAGTAVGTAIGIQLASKKYEPLVEGLQMVNTELFRLTELQERQIAELLNKAGALEVKVQTGETNLMEAKLKATESALELLEYRVEATAEAYVQDGDRLREIMGKMPSVLVHNSFKIIMEHSRDLDAENIELIIKQGSGIVTHYKPDEEKLIVLTARHLLEPTEDYDFHKLLLSQPHLDQQELTYTTDHYKTSLHTESDIGIITANTTLQPLPRDVKKSVMIEEDWKPEIGEELFSISFPGKASRGVGYTPSIFKVLGKEDGGAAVITDSIIGSGASGAPVAKADGTIVGIYVAVGKLGSYVLPIRDSYREVQMTGT